MLEDGLSIMLGVKKKLYIQQQNLKNIYFPGFLRLWK